MGRVKKFDRDQALLTIMNEIWRKGYEACSVKALSETLGITRSSFYNSFGTREELFLEILQMYLEQSPDFALHTIESEHEILKEICLIFRNVCLTRANDPNHRGCLATNSIAELVGNDDKVGTALSEAAQATLACFKRLLTLAVKKGELKCDDVHSTALALQNLLLGINVMSKVIHDESELWSSVRLSLQGLNIYKPTFTF